MKLLLAIAALCAAIVPCSAATVAAAAPTPAPKPNVFPTLAACTAAVEAGNFRFYEPKYFGLKGKHPANDDDTVVVPLEADVCLEMMVVGGRKFVAQAEGTLFRARKRADGSLELFARDDCGNPVYGFTLSPPTPTPEPAVTPTPVQVAPPAPIMVVPRVYHSSHHRSRKGAVIAAAGAAVGVAVAVIALRSDDDNDKRKQPVAPPPSAGPAARLEYQMFLGSFELPKEQDGGYTVATAQSLQFVGQSLRFVAWLVHSAREGCRAFGSVGPQPTDVYEKLGGLASPSPLQLAGVAYSFPIASTQRIKVTLEDTCDPRRLDTSVRVTVK